MLSIYILCLASVCSNEAYYLVASHVPNMTYPAGREMGFGSASILCPALGVVAGVPCHHGKETVA